VQQQVKQHWGLQRRLQALLHLLPLQKWHPVLKSQQQLRQRQQQQPFPDSSTGASMQTMACAS
jgi:hypothetical protein